MQRRPKRELLTTRQRQVLVLWSTGRTLDEIAERLGLRRRTVLKYLEDARARVGANNDAHLLRIALETGALAPAEHHS